VTERTAIVAGATGLVGRHLVARLLMRPEWTRVTVVGRRTPPIEHSRLESLAARLDGLDRALSGRRWDDAFCCLGTTMKKAGSKAAFRAVDLDGVTAFARAARSAGAGFLGLVSAAGASADSTNFYLQTKGHAEREVEACRFPSLAIARPGVLKGQRDESRPAERLAILVAPLTDVLMQGPLARYRSVAADVVADALVVAALDAKRGARRLEPEDMQMMAGRLRQGPLEAAPSNR
jgi:uncharacterized protein YbjT (DUF2867 family)